MTNWTPFKGFAIVGLLTVSAAGACSKKESSNASAPAKAGTTGTTTSGGSGTTPPCLHLDGGTGTLDESTASSTAAGTTTADETVTGTAAETTGSTTSGTTTPSTGDCGNTGAATGTTETGTTTGTETATGTTGSVGDMASLSPGPGIDGCAAEQKIWIPPTETAAAMCGDAIYEDVCCNDVNNFYKAVGTTVAAQLKAKVTAAGADQLVWYGCSKNGGKYAMHAAKYVYSAAGTANVQYYSMFVNYPSGGPSIVGQPTTCAEVSLTDLGYQGAATGTSTTTDTLDLSACGITDSSQAGVKAWLTNATNYAGSSWVKDAAVRAKTANSPHGKHKTVFNRTLYNSANLTTLPSIHPTGSCAVQQMFNTAGTAIVGYALMVKTTAGGPSGENWFFYDIPDLTATTEHYGMNETSCVGCHTSSAELNDFVRTKPVP